MTNLSRYRPTFCIVFNGKILPEIIIPCASLKMCIRDRIISVVNAGWQYLKMILNEYYKADDKRSAK